MNPNDYYREYWKNKKEMREKNKYYDNIYNRVKKKLKSSDRILDVGGGNAQFLEYIGVKKALVVDISESGLEIAKNNGFDVIKADVQKNFPLLNENFDVVYCMEVLEHLDEPNKTISEISRILKNDGICFFSIPTQKPDGKHHKKRWKMNEIIKDLNNHILKIEWFDNNLIISKHNLKTIWKTQGFFNKFKKIISTFFYYIIPKIILYKLGHMFPDNLSSLQIIKAKKTRQ